MEMASSLKSNKRKTIRSTSFPSRLHPSSCKIEEELNILKTWEGEALTAPTAETICNGLWKLGELYNATDDFLDLPMTRQAISNHQHGTFIDELLVLLDGSVRLLDICETARDIMSQIKLHVRDLQSALRRRKGDLVVEFENLRKKIKKDVKKMIVAVKQLENKSSTLQFSDPDDHLMVVIRVLKEVNGGSISVFGYVLLFLSNAILKPKATKWSIVSRLVHQGAVACEDGEQDANELERVKALEVGVESIETCLESMFRHFVRTRASLLNIVSQ